jgi:hypothetical protein
MRLAFLVIILRRQFQGYFADAAICGEYSGVGAGENISPLAY